MLIKLLLRHFKERYIALHHNNITISYTSSTAFHIKSIELRSCLEVLRKKVSLRSVDENLVIRYTDAIKLAATQLNSSKLTHDGTSAKPVANCKRVRTKQQKICKLMYTLGGSMQTETKKIKTKRKQKGSNPLKQICQP